MSHLADYKGLSTRCSKNTIIMLMILGDSDGMTEVKLEDSEEQPLTHTGSLSPTYACS